MNRPKTIATVTLVMVWVTTLALSGCVPAEAKKLNVVTSTSHIAQIAKRVGGDRVNVVNIIPPAQCPGHFDVKPSDIQNLADADLFLFHGWHGDKFSQELITSANNPDLSIVKLDIQGNWMTPPVQLEATDKIAVALSQVDTQNSATYQQSAAEYKDKISSKEVAIKVNLDKVNLSDVNVMCAEQQVGFVRWIGLNIVATYGQPESFTPQLVRELVDIGRESKVTLIIDNVQSGQNAGAGVADELGCTRIILSNFPGCFSGTETWEKAIDQNIKLILGALAF